MAQKPFTDSPEKKMEKMVQAASHILSAIQALTEAQACAENWAEHETLGYFKWQLNEFMSCDSGEAGFEPYMQKKSDQVFVGKPNPIRAAREMAKKYKS